MISAHTIHRPIAATALLSLACCSPVPTPAPAPAPAPAATQAPVVQRTATPPPTIAAAAPANWMDAPATPGNWSYRATNGVTQAIFGQNPSSAALVMTCNPQRGIVTLYRAGSTGAARPMRILTETTSRDLTGVTTSNENPAIMVDIQARDPLLDAMSISKGRFAVETAGMPTLYVPSWPEVTRVVEDCR